MGGNQAHAAFSRGANVDNFRFHDLRHEFASKLMQKGHDLYVVQSLLGHSDGRMTQGYAHLRVESIREAVKKLDEGHKKGHSEKEKGAASAATP
jgi:site-specific recombinase XerD